MESVCVSVRVSVPFEVSRNQNLSYSFNRSYRPAYGDGGQKLVKTSRSKIMRVSKLLEIFFTAQTTSDIDVLMVCSLYIWKLKNQNSMS